MTQTDNGVVPYKLEPERILTHAWRGQPPRGALLALTNKPLFECLIADPMTTERPFETPMEHRTLCDYACPT